MGKRKIHVKGTVVASITRHEEHCISLTGRARGFGDDTVLYGWLRNKNTVEFVGSWGRLNNPDLKPLEFGRLMSEAGSNRLPLSPSKWMEATHAIGLISNAHPTRP